MNTLGLFLVLAVSCAAFGSPSEFNHRPSSRFRRDVATDTISIPTDTNVSFFGGSGYGKLVGELIGNLQKAAQQAREAISTFNAGVREEVGKSRDKFIYRMEQLREGVAKAMLTVSDRISSSNAAVRECINSHNGETEALLKDSMEKANACTNDHLEEAADMVTSLTNISDNAQEFTNAASTEMRNCSLNGGNFFAIGACLGSVALKTEIKGAVFLTQSGLSVARLNLFLTTLPAALEVCAGTGLVGAGLGTARIVMEIGSCSASSIFTNLTGNNVPSSSSIGTK